MSTKITTLHGHEVIVGRSTDPTRPLLSLGVRPLRSVEAGGQPLYVTLDKDSFDALVALGELAFK